MYRVVSALSGADGVRTSGIAFKCGHRIVAALAVGVADGVNRREIDDIEAHRRDIRQPRDAILERAVLAGDLALAARHHLVPCAVSRPPPVRHQWKQLRSRQVGSRLAFGHGVLQFSGQERSGITGLQIFLALPYNDCGRGVSAELRLRQHARAFDRVEGKVDAGFLLELESVPPGGEFVGPGLDRIDVAPGLVRDEQSAPAVVAVMGHRRAAPFPIALATPDQRRAHHIVPVAIDIRPDFDALSNDTLHRKAAAFDARINIFNMKSAADRGALDSLSCFVHGDAIDMETTSLFDCGKGDVPDIYRSRSPGIGSRGTPGIAESKTAILFEDRENFVTPLTVACKRCAEWTFSPKLKTSGSRPNFSTVRVTFM